MKIFVSIAAYRDKLLWDTVESAISHSHDPSKLHFAIVDQGDTPYNVKKHTYADQISYLHINPQYSRGPCWARSLALSFYSDEDYVLQIDAHTIFDKNWDIKLIDQLTYCQTLSNKCILSAYPHAFEITNTGIKKFKQQNIVNVLRPKHKGKMLSNDPTFNFEGHSISSESPIKGFHIAGGFIFAPGNYFLEIPYDSSLYFTGEEQNLAIRSYTHGWDIYHVPIVPIYHLYYRAGNRPLHWDQQDDSSRLTKWVKLNEKSKKRMCDLLYHGKNLGAYGLGNIRTLQDFAEFSGIDYDNKFVTEKYPR